MKKLLMATALTALAAGAATAEEVKLGIALGFTGPAESLAPGMADGAELALAQMSGDANFFGGSTISTVRGDSSCVDAGIATSVGERMIAEDVDGIIGALCSGATIAILQNVALPNGMVLFSPSATSPALTDIEDNGLFFRASPSDARQGQVLAEVLNERGVTSVAVTYTNNDYGKGLADSFSSAFKAIGGEITIEAAHEDGKADYSAEVGSMASAGGEMLVVVGYLDQGGPGIIRAALDTGAFDAFVLPDAMVGDSISDAFGTEIEGSFGTVPGSDSAGTEVYFELATAAGFDGTAPYSSEGYDAGALMGLAMAAAKSTDPAVYKDFVYAVSNAPGEPILPGELPKALEILANGGEIDYVGATALELIEPGEAAGGYREVEIKDGAFTTVKFR
ncbi:putative periplasmic ligand-binding protein [Actibacterium atlanticum]|uniref:Putative periplasmic ligand-binding protein n=1 Tax=Actibacterium atlanticum TaxID=1461693 RepID=A0A058ZPX6_9RHOB|nr:ABC transporter substrate-binding protein [Actibacterium atlanticum]KCV83649.1 putative periplasmic ligand-binding protein [Actibacterium atlanticum]